MTRLEKAYSTTLFVESVFLRNMSILQHEQDNILSTYSTRLFVESVSAEHKFPSQNTTYGLTGSILVKYPHHYAFHFCYLSVVPSEVAIESHCSVEELDIILGMSKVVGGQVDRKIDV